MNIRDITKNSRLRLVCTIFIAILCNLASAQISTQSMQGQWDFQKVEQAVPAPPLMSEMSGIDWILDGKDGLHPAPLYVTQNAKIKDIVQRVASSRSGVAINFTSVTPKKLLSTLLALANNPTARENVLALNLAPKLLKNITVLNPVDVWKFKYLRVVRFGLAGQAWAPVTKKQKDIINQQDIKNWLHVFPKMVKGIIIDLPAEQFVFTDRALKTYLAAVIARQMEAITLSVNSDKQVAIFSQAWPYFYKNVALFGLFVTAKVTLNGVRMLNKLPLKPGGKSANAMVLLNATHYAIHLTQRIIQSNANSLLALSLMGPIYSENLANVVSQANNLRYLRLDYQAYQETPYLYTKLLGNNNLRFLLGNVPVNMIAANKNIIEKRKTPLILGGPAPAMPIKQLRPLGEQR
jgi:hypothetical protein